MLCGWNCALRYGLTFKPFGARVKIRRQLTTSTRHVWCINWGRFENEELCRIRNDSTVTWPNSVWSEQADLWRMMYMFRWKCLGPNFKIHNLLSLLFFLVFFFWKTKDFIDIQRYKRFLATRTDEAYTLWSQTTRHI